jgi:hypothetical protein
MKIEINKTYYFNNRPVVVIREENEEFVFVAAHLKLDHNLTGSNFCIPCNTDGYYHTCEQAGEIIEFVMDEIEDSDCFWVAKRYLNEHPFEYKECVVLKEQIEKFKVEKTSIASEISTLKEESQGLNTYISEAQDYLQSLKSDIEAAQEDKQELLEENLGIKESIVGKASVKNTNITLTTDRLLELLNAEIKLSYLERGGVDNWEWYGEALNDYSEDEAFEELKSMS